jgi:hypothetical protein
MPYALCALRKKVVDFWIPTEYTLNVRKLGKSPRAYMLLSRKHFAILELISGMCTYLKIRDLTH